LDQFAQRWKDFVGASDGDARHTAGFGFRKNEIVAKVVRANFDRKPQTAGVGSNIPHEELAKGSVPQHVHRTRLYFGASEPAEKPWRELGVTVDRHFQEANWPATSASTLLQSLLLLFLTGCVRETVGGAAELVRQWCGELRRPYPKV
jgi:hypothetical protein